MTKTEAIYNFWSSFNLPAYEENSVPTGENSPVLPYITYQLVMGSFGETTYMTASIWAKDTVGKSTLKFLENKINEISRYIGTIGKAIKIDEGTIWIRRGNPFAQISKSTYDNSTKRAILNITADYITNN